MEENENENFQQDNFEDMSFEEDFEDDPDSEVEEIETQTKKKTVTIENPKNSFTEEFEDDFEDEEESDDPKMSERISISEISLGDVESLLQKKEDELRDLEELEDQKRKEREKKLFFKENGKNEINWNYSCNMFSQFVNRKRSKKGNKRDYNIKKEPQMKEKFTFSKEFLKILQYSNHNRKLKRYVEEQERELKNYRPSISKSKEFEIGIKMFVKEKLYPFEKKKMKKEINKIKEEMIIREAKKFPRHSFHEKIEKEISKGFQLQSQCRSDKVNNLLRTNLKTILQQTKTVNENYQTHKLDSKKKKVNF